MAFFRRRRFFRRKRTTQKKRANRKFATIGSVKRIIARREEHKYQTGELDAVNVIATGSVTKMVSVSQGDTDSTRDGDELRISRITFRGNFTVNNTAVFNRCRLIIFQWKQSDTDVTPTVAMILNNTANTTQLIDGITNHDRSDLFNILYDKTHYVNYYGTAMSRIRGSARKFNHVQKFTGGATTGTNQIYALYVADQITNTPTMNLQVAMHYTDS